MYWRLTAIIRLNNFKFIYMRISFLTLLTCFPRQLEAAAVERLEHCRIQDGGYGPRGLLVCFMQIQTQMGSAYIHILYLK